MEDKMRMKSELKRLGIELGKLQRECRNRKIPVIILFEGCGASGKGVQISGLIQNMDPRGFIVHASKNETEEESMHPFLWRYWTRIPKQGQFAIFDSSWYRKVMLQRMKSRITEKEAQKYYDSICGFEEQLVNSGMIIIKIFLKIDKKEQKKRLKRLMEVKETRWRVSKTDLEQNRHFRNYMDSCEEAIRYTDVKKSSWDIIDATDRKKALLEIYERVIAKITNSLYGKREEKEIVLGPFSSLKLSDYVEPEIHFTKEEYEKLLKKYQKKICMLHSELYRRKIPVVLAFEGWDAAGKGGAIKRLTKTMDPRGYVVYPTAAPDEQEKQYHYLWRFWKSMPKKGHVSIFDRTWYGRVLVERIEGFCTENEWKRAYKEINDMEKDLTDSNTIVLKFWMNIDKDEQEKRFKDRMKNPDKQWKITEEDWRNREKWDAYEEAVKEMLARTSTQTAPWIVIEGNSKYYARLKVLKTVIEAIEAKI